MYYVIADPPAGNVFIREAPSVLSPSVGKPAYNHNNYGVIYEVDDEREIDGATWIHLRGFGWSMAKFFKAWEPGSSPAPDPSSSWVLGLTRSEVLQLIDYLTAAVKGDD